MAWAQTERGRIYYQIVGTSGPILVLLRGLGRSSRYWLGLDEKLADEGFQVLTLDARGLGRSEARMEWGDRIEDLAEDLLKVLDQAGLARVHLLGHSLGGMVALEFARKYPLRLKSLIVSSSSSADSGAPRLAPAIWKGLVPALLRKKAPALLLRHLVQPTASDEARHVLGEAWAQIQKVEGWPLRTVIAQLGAARRFSIADRFAQHEVPTLFLSGSEDQLVPAANTQGLHQKFPKARLHWIEGAGHEIAFSHEAELIQTISTFVREQP